MTSGSSTLLLRAALAATLLLTANTHEPSPQLTGVGDDLSINRLVALLRSLHSVDTVGKLDSEQGPSWKKRSDPPPRCYDPASSHSTVTGANNDTDGAPLDSTDFDNALKPGYEGRPVDEPMFHDDSWLDDIVCTSKSTLSSSSDVQNNAIQDQDKKWPGGEIPYTIASGFNSKDRAAIASSVLQLERSTCIRLRAKSSADTDYVRIIRGSGCYSSVGRQHTGGQELSLGSGCLYSGIVVHEMMHAIGFWHEQSRPDRDRYVRIHYSNIKSGALHNFDKYTWKDVQNLSMPYDVGSIMHYGPHAFARDRTRPTITALRQTSAQMGQRHGLSQTDIYKINRLYDCGGTIGPTTGSRCTDRSVYCEEWADSGECDANPLYMHVHCALSCDTCSEQVDCEDKHKYCSAWATSSECDKNPTYMGAYCKKACGLCTDRGTTANCTDEDRYCQAWAEAGECSNNPSYMHQSCRRACSICG